MNKIIGNDYMLGDTKIRLTSIDGEKAIYWNCEFGKYDWLHVENLKTLKVIDVPQVKKEEPKPIYTAAMCESGELPSVGMEFISTEFGQDRHSIVKAITNEYIIYICADPKHVSECCMEICANNFKPIDTRTDEEKATDKTVFDLMFFGCQSINDPQARELITAIKAGKIHNVTWSK